MLELLPLFATASMAASAVSGMLMSEPFETNYFLLDLYQSRKRLKLREILKMIDHPKVGRWTRTRIITGLVLRYVSQIAFVITIGIVVIHIVSLR